MLARTRSSHSVYNLGDWMPAWLSRTIGRRLLQLAAVASATALAWPAVRLGRAAWLSFSSNPQDWQRAAALEPDDADAWRRLGLYAQWNLANSQPERAIAYLERAVQLNPHATATWLDLAVAYEAQGQLARAAQAYQNAQRTFPASAEVAWSYGSFLLRRGDPMQAAACIQRALVTHEELSPAAVAEFWRAGFSAAWILDHVLPAQPSAYLQAMDFFLNQGETAAAQQAWDRIVARQAATPLLESVKLVNAWLAEKQVSAARSVWMQALALAGVPAPNDQQLIFNGTFTRDPLNGGFDWHLESAPGVRISLDPLVTCSGQRALRMEFDGTQNNDFRQVYQIVPITAGRRYRLQACLRTQQLTTDQGILLAITPLDQPDRELAATPALNGTAPWTTLTAEFTAGPDLHAVVVWVRRHPSTRLENRIAGVAWVDNVRLETLADLDGER